MMHTPMMTTTDRNARDTLQKKIPRATVTDIGTDVEAKMGQRENTGTLRRIPPTVQTATDNLATPGLRMVPMELLPVDPTQVR